MLFDKVFCFFLTQNSNLLTYVNQDKISHQDFFEPDSHRLFSLPDSTGKNAIDFIITSSCLLAVQFDILWSTRTT
jgi:hypothetical protein